MSLYRRLFHPGGTYFFTVVTQDRRPILCRDEVRHALRGALQTVRQEWPFVIVAWVLLPDHLHAIWTLPPGDTDFPRRWGRIKALTVKALPAVLRDNPRTAAQTYKREASVWQRRFWEHLIRDEEDFAAHLDYLHFNPVKHGYTERVVDWPWSTFHRYVRAGVYPMEWGGVPGEGPESLRE